MTVAAPPRPRHPSDPVDRDELEALVEALIEEARQRARRRRRIYAASVALVALVVVAVSTIVDRATQPDTASPVWATRSWPGRMLVPVGPSANVARARATAMSDDDASGCRSLRAASVREFPTRATAVRLVRWRKRMLRGDV